MSATETRKVRDIDIDDVEKLTKEEAKAILINSLDSRFDDESDDCTGWTLDFTLINEEDVFSEMIGVASGGMVDGEKFVGEVVEELGLNGELDRYTNIYFYFVRESFADTLVQELQNRIKAF